MKDKRILIIGGLVAVLLVAIPLTVYIASQQQDVRSSAQVPPGTTTASVPSNTPTATNAPTSTGTPTATVTPTVTVAPSPTGVTTTPTPSGTITPSPTGTGGSCQTPGAVTGVEFTYPSCQGTQCDFTQASCTWAPVNGATSYTVKITQVESGTITSTTTVTAPTVTSSFAVEQGKTYRCDIAAVNSCGTSGSVGSAEALCSVDGQVSAPTTAPTTAAAPTQQVIPTVVPTGDLNTTMLAGIGGVVITIIGGLLFFFSGI